MPKQGGNKAVIWAQCSRVKAPSLTRQIETGACNGFAGARAPLRRYHSAVDDWLMASSTDGLLLIVLRLLLSLLSLLRLPLSPEEEEEEALP